MLANGDRSARNAFRVGLVEEPSRPNLTQELDPSDILEVQDVAAAIARAEELARKERSSSNPGRGGFDVFDALVQRTNTPIPGTLRSPRITDDAVGPAGYREVVPTPVPPPAKTKADAVVVPKPAAVPSAPVLMVPVTREAVEDDAFFHPGARIRTLADQTLESYRPEPTLMVRIRQRRGTLSWVVAALLLPLVLLAGVGLWIGSAEAATPMVAQAPKHITFAKVSVAPPQAKVVAPSAPTFDVNTLPTAKSR